MQDIELIPCNEKDIPAIALLAEKIWNIHYPPIIGQVQVNYMLAKMYNAESLKTQMNLNKDLFYFISSKKNNIGFISVTHKDEQLWFLNKFYILPEHSAKGLGTFVLNEIFKITRSGKMQLTVNRKNFKSINFYFKNGFTIKEVKDFDIGNGYFMEDFVMEKA